MNNPKDNFYLKKKDLLGTANIEIADQDSTVLISIVDGKVTNVQSDKGNKFNVNDINTQLDSGATIGQAISGESSVLREIIKEAIYEAYIEKILRENINDKLLQEYRASDIMGLIRGLKKIPSVAKIIKSVAQVDGQAALIRTVDGNAYEVVIRPAKYSSHPDIKAKTIKRK